MCTMLCLFVWDGLGSKLQISAAETRFVRLIAPVRYRDQSHHRAFFLFFYFLVFFFFGVCLFLFFVCVNLVLPVHVCQHR